MKLEFNGLQNDIRTFTPGKLNRFRLEKSSREHDNRCKTIAPSMALESQSSCWFLANMT